MMVSGMNGKAWYGNNGEEFDFVNTVEKTVIPSPLNGEFIAVHLMGTHIPTGSQAGALVVAGPVLETECPATMQCPNGCSGAGDCKEGICQCHGGRQGIDCSLIETLLESCKPVRAVTSPLQVRHFEFESQGQFTVSATAIANAQIEIRVASSIGGPVIASARNTQANPGASAFIRSSTPGYTPGRFFITVLSQTVASFVITATEVDPNPILLTNQPITACVGVGMYRYFEIQTNGAFSLGVKLTPHYGDADMFVSVYNPNVLPSRERYSWKSDGAAGEYIQLSSHATPGSRFSVAVYGFLPSRFEISIA